MGSAAAAVALPAVSRDLGLSTGQSAWLFSAYVLFLAVATPLYGRASDVFGLRRPLVVGVAVMAAGSLAAAVAPDFVWLVVARVLQGAGAAAVPVLAVVAVRARF